MTGVKEREADGAVLKPAELVPVEDARTTLVIFGSLAAGIDIPPFEFRRMTDPLHANKLFLRDMRQAWYQRQFRDGLLATLPEDDARRAREWLSSTRTVFLGHSMGGFAAILFGATLGADRVLAFSPQTFVSPLLRVRHRDNRWARQILRMYARHGLARRSYNLRSVLKRTNRAGRIDLFHGDGSRFDTAHVAHLADLPGVAVTVVPGARHGAVKHLRESGALERVLKDAAAAADASGAGERR